MNRALQSAFAVVALFQASSPTFAAPPLYDLKVLPVGQGSAAYALNESGDVVGSGFFSGSPTQHPFVFDAQTGTVQNLNVLAGERGIATGINELGMVTGFIDDGRLKPFIYDGVIFSTIDVAQLGFDAGVSSAINDQGQVAGTLRNDDGAASAFFYDGQLAIDLGALGGNTSFGEGLNNSGVVVGAAQLEQSSVLHAFAFQDEVMQDLGTLNSTFPDSIAVDINDAGLTVGYVSEPAGAGLTSAAIFVNGMAQLLGTLSNDPEAESSHANGVNDAGAIVGDFQVPAALPRGFIYSDGEMYDLNLYVRNPRAITIVEANAINNAGQIAGRAQRPDGSLYAVVLTPVPEPTAIALAAICAACIAFARTRPRLGRVHQ